MRLTRARERGKGQLETAVKGLPHRPLPSHYSPPQEPAPTEADPPKLQVQGRRRRVPKAGLPQRLEKTEDTPTHTHTTGHIGKERRQKSPLKKASEKLSPPTLGGQQLQDPTGESLSRSMPDARVGF